MNVSILGPSEVLYAQESISLELRRNLLAFLMLVALVGMLRFVGLLALICAILLLLWEFVMCRRFLIDSFAFKVDCSSMVCFYRHL